MLFTKEFKEFAREISQSDVVVVCVIYDRHEFTLFRAVIVSCLITLGEFTRSLASHVCVFVCPHRGVVFTKSRDVFAQKESAAAGSLQGSK